MNLRRHRKPLSALLLGVWLFALFVGIANACATEGSPLSPGQGVAMLGDMGDQQPSANCLQFCADDTPVFSKLQLVPDQPLGHALRAVTTTYAYLPSAALERPVILLAGPPPGVPVLLRSSRLAL